MNGYYVNKSQNNNSRFQITPIASDPDWKDVRLWAVSGVTKTTSGLVIPSVCCCTSFGECTVIDLISFEPAKITKKNYFSDMTMLSSSLFILTTLILVTDRVKPYPHLIKIDDRIERRNLLDERCRQCGFNEDCFDEPAGGCVNGVYKDKCGYINCFKGPGEHCDKSGRNKCAPNLLCKCNVCKGCQKNRLKVYQCFYGEDKMCLGDLASEEKF